MVRGIVTAIEAMALCVVGRERCGRASKMVSWLSDSRVAADGSRSFRKRRCFSALFARLS